MDFNYSRNIAKMTIYTVELLRSHVCHSCVTRALSKGETFATWQSKKGIKRNTRKKSRHPKELKIPESTDASQNTRGFLNYANPSPHYHFFPRYSPLLFLTSTRQLWRCHNTCFFFLFFSSDSQFYCYIAKTYPSTEIKVQISIKFQTL